MANVGDNNRDLNTRIRNKTINVSLIAVYYYI